MRGIACVLIFALAAVVTANDFCPSSGPCGFTCNIARTVTSPPSDCWTGFATTALPCAGAADQCTNVCTYNLSTLATSHPPTIRNEGVGVLGDFESRVEADTLHIAWNEPLPYYWDAVDHATFQQRVSFPNAKNATACALLWAEDSGPENTTDEQGCYNIREINGRWSQVYGSPDDNQCGMSVNNNDTEFLIFILEMVIHYRADVGFDRNDAVITRDYDFRYQIQVNLLKRINITVDPVNVVSPIFFQTAITEQVASFALPNGQSTEPRMHLELLTSVQAPFDTVLRDPVDGVFSTPTNVESVEVTAVTDKAQNGMNRVTVDDCTDDQPCEYVWEMDFKQVEGETICEFTGDYELRFTSTCSPPPVGGNPNGDGPFINETTGLPNANCSVDTATDDVTVILQVQTADFCPTIVDNVNLQATAATYRAQECVNPLQDSCDPSLAFLHSQTLFFTAQVTSPQASIEATNWRRCIVSRAGFADLTIFDVDFAGSNTGFYQWSGTPGGQSGVADFSFPRFQIVVDTIDPTVGDGTGSSVLAPDGTTLVTVPDPILPEGPATNIFTLAADQNTPIDIACTIDVTFQNVLNNEQLQGRTQSVDVSWKYVSGSRRRFEKLASSGVKASLDVPSFRLQEEEATVSATFGVTGFTAGTVTPPAASPAVSTTTIVIAAVGAVGGVSMLALVGVMARRRGGRTQRNKGANDSSSTLSLAAMGNSSSTGSLNGTEDATTSVVKTGNLTVFV